jgi:hypothetical protein
MLQQKQIIEYWFSTNIFSAPVCVKIKMVERDEAKAKQLFEEMMHPLKCSIIEKPTEGKFMMVNEEWEL